MAVNPATFDSPDLDKEVESLTSAAVLPVEVQPEACPDEDFIAVSFVSLRTSQKSSVYDGAVPVQFPFIERGKSACNQL